MILRRLISHAFYPKFRVNFTFPNPVLDKIENLIAESELQHAAQLRFAIEAGLPLTKILHSNSSRARALEVFSNLRVWDTEENCGVLIYVQLADRSIEIVADRGINAKVRPTYWQEISDQVIDFFKRAEFENGSLFAIKQISSELIKHFPRSSRQQNSNTNELSDRPVVI